MNFNEYLKNKDLQITNDDIDIEKLTNDLRKGYYSESDFNSKIETEKSKWNPKETDDYADIENKYNTAIKDLNAANETIQKQNLEFEMLSNGFNKENFEEVSKLRYSLYPDEKDNSKAIKNIAERFKDTYFKSEQEQQKQNGYDSNYMKGGESSKKNEVKITRNTSISSLIKK